MFSVSDGQYSPELFTPEQETTPASPLAATLPVETRDEEDLVPVAGELVMNERWRTASRNARRQQARQQAWPYPLVDTPNRMRAARGALRRADGRIPLAIIAGIPRRNIFPARMRVADIFSPSRVCASTPQRAVFNIFRDSPSPPAPEDQAAAGPSGWVPPVAASQSNNSSSSSTPGWRAQRAAALFEEELAQLTGTTWQSYLSTNESALTEYTLAESPDNVRPVNRDSGYGTQLSLFDDTFPDIPPVAFPYFNTVAAPEEEEENENYPF